MKTEEFEEPEHISIHASAKEATVKMSALGEKLNFNPRLREGGD